MNNHQKGFSIVEILIVLVVIGLIGAVGWLTYDRLNSKTDSQQQPTTTTSSPTSKSSDTPAKKQETVITLVSSRGINLVANSLPTGWKATEKCVDDTALILPPERTSIKCGTEDFGFIALSIIEANKADAPRNCDGVEAKRTEYKQYDWFVSYNCELVTIDGKQAVHETTVQNENAAFAGANTYDTYTIRLSNETAVTASFTNAKDTGRPEHTNIFNDFVKSLKFQSS